MKPNEHYWQLRGHSAAGLPPGALCHFRLVLMLGAALLISQPAPREQVGPMPDGGFLLSSGWRIKAAGTQIPVDTFPMATAITPDKKFLLVLNGGYNPPSISVIDIAAAKEVSRSPVPDGWLGLDDHQSGRQSLCGRRIAKAAIYEFSLANGVLKPSRMFPIVAEKDRKPEDFIGDVQFSPDGHLLYAANLYRDSVVVVNPQSGTGSLAHQNAPPAVSDPVPSFGQELLCFQLGRWLDRPVRRPSSGELLATTPVGPHTTDMVWREGGVEDHPNVNARLFVSASNTNSVYVLGVDGIGRPLAARNHQSGAHAAISRSAPRPAVSA